MEQEAKAKPAIAFATHQRVWWLNIKNQILRNPKEFSVDYFDAPENCGSTHCLLGWHVIINLHFDSFRAFADQSVLVGEQGAIAAGAETLGVTSCYFFASNWSDRYRSGQYKTDPKVTPEDAARFIDDLLDGQHVLCN